MRGGGGAANLARCCAFELTTQHQDPEVAAPAPPPPPPSLPLSLTPRGVGNRASGEVGNRASRGSGLTRRFCDALHQQTLRAMASREHCRLCFSLPWPDWDGNFDMQNSAGPAFSRGQLNLTMHSQPRNVYQNVHDGHHWWWT